MNPKVSIILPTFNRADFLSRALDSVRSQSFREWECIVVDDGSTDETAELLASASREDVRLRPIRLSHGGLPGRTRNAGLNASRGEFVAFLDDDDLWLPHKLETQVSLFEAQPEIAMTFSRVERFGDATGPWPRRLPERLSLRHLLASNPVACSTVVVRQSVLERTGPFDESLRVAEDFELWIRIALVAMLAGQPQSLARYCVDARRLREQAGTRIDALERILAAAGKKVPSSFLRPGWRRVHRYRARHAPNFRESFRDWWRAITA